MVLLVLSQQLLRADGCLYQTQTCHLGTQEESMGGGTFFSIAAHFVISANKTAVFLCTEIMLSATLIL